MNRSRRSLGAAVALLVTACPAAAANAPRLAHLSDRALIKSGFGNSLWSGWEPFAPSGFTAVKGTPAPAFGGLALATNSNTTYPSGANAAWTLTAPPGVGIFEVRMYGLQHTAANCATQTSQTCTQALAGITAPNGEWQSRLDLRSTTPAQSPVFCASGNPGPAPAPSPQSAPACSTDIDRASYERNSVRIELQALSPEGSPSVSVGSQPGSAAFDAIDMWYKDFVAPTVTTTPRDPGGRTTTRQRTVTATATDIGGGLAHGPRTAFILDGGKQRGPGADNPVVCNHLMFQCETSKRWTFTYRAPVGVSRHKLRVVDQYGNRSAVLRWTDRVSTSGS